MRRLQWAPPGLGWRRQAPLRCQQCKLARPVLARPTFESRVDFLKGARAGDGGRVKLGAEPALIWIGAQACVVQRSETLTVPTHPIATSAPKQAAHRRPDASRSTCAQALCESGAGSAGRGAAVKPQGRAAGGRARQHAAACRPPHPVPRAPTSRQHNGVGALGRQRLHHLPPAGGRRAAQVRLPLRGGLLQAAGKRLLCCATRLERMHTQPPPPPARTFSRSAW